ncbi:hypothetical protein ACSSS7_007352 [Eimeria intestinalis]
MPPFGFAWFVGGLQPQVWLVLCCALFKLNDLSVTMECLDELRERLKSCGIPEDHPMSQHEKQLRGLVREGLLEQQQQQQQQQQEQQQQQGEESEAESDASQDEGEINPD